MTKFRSSTALAGERMRAIAGASMALGFALLSVAPVSAQPPCPTGTVLSASVALVDAAPTIPNSIIILPNGAGQTLASRGLTIEVCVTCSGAPLVGAPAAAVTLSGPGIAVCTAGGNADAPTDAAGCTTFTGTIIGGGCGVALEVNVGATVVGTVAVEVRSPDAPGVSPGYIDAGDLAFFAASLPSALGSTTFNPCVDFNVDSFVDASDLSYFASVLGIFGTACP